MHFLKAYNSRHVRHSLSLFFSCSLSTLRCCVFNGNPKSELNFSLKHVILWAWKFNFTIYQYWMSSECTPHAVQADTECNTTSRIIINKWVTHTQYRRALAHTPTRSCEIRYFGCDFASVSTQLNVSFPCSNVRMFFHHSLFLLLLQVALNSNIMVPLNMCLFLRLLFVKPSIHLFLSYIWLNDAVHRTHRNETTTENSMRKT